ncbi:MAG: ABC transporter permease [bacterium]|nr:ABC transporter permease [bacterium]
MANRVVVLAVVLLAVVIIGFTITRSTGTPLYASLGVAVSEAIIEQRAEEMGLNEPIVVQFWTYLTHLLQGDLGVSRISRIPVAEDIALKLPATAEMVFFTLMVSFIWAIPLGVRAGLRPDGKLARLGEGMAQFGVSVPAFWLGLLFIFLLYFLPPRLPDPLGPLPSLFPPPLGRVGSGITPPEMVTGLYTLDALIAGDFRLAWHALWHLILPAVTLSLTSGPPLFRVTRSAVSEAVSSPFVEAAYSYGLGRRTVLVRDVLRNASPPVLNLAAMTFGYLIGGGVLVEVVFSWPGIGSFAVWGMDNSDYDVVLAVVIIAAVIYVILYFIVDLIQFAMDPRLRD